MRSSIFPPTVLAAILTACATDSVVLNSERIEQRFGSYGIELLESEAGLRRTNLVSYDGETATCRTYAVVQFSDQLDSRYRDTHLKVLAGGSIGETFKEAGWEIRKKSLYIGSVRLPASGSQVGDLMRVVGAHDLALHVYELVVVKEDAALEYAIILEAHHPEYLTEEDLYNLFAYEAPPSLAADELAQLAELVTGPQKGN